MTVTTSRYNVKPVLRGVALVVMVILCLLGAVMALQSVGSGQLAGSDSFIYSILRPLAFGMTKAILFLGISSFFALFVTPTGNFTLLALFVASLGTLAFVSFTILLHILFFTGLALEMKAIFAVAVFVKLRERLNLFAMTTSFGYALLSHLILSPIKNYLVRAVCPACPGVRLALLYG